MTLRGAHEAATAGIHPAAARGQNRRANLRDNFSRWKHPPAQLVLDGLARRVMRQTVRNTPGDLSLVSEDDPSRTQLRREARGNWAAIDRALTRKYRLVSELAAAEDVAERVALALLIAREDRTMVDLGRELDRLEDELRSLAMPYKEELP